MGENQDLQASHCNPPEGSRTEGAGALSGSRHNPGRLPSLRRHGGLLRHRSSGPGHAMQRPDHDAGQLPRHSIADELDGAVPPRRRAPPGRQPLHALERRPLAGAHRQSLRRTGGRHRPRPARLARLQPLPLLRLLRPPPAHHALGAAALQRPRPAAQAHPQRRRLTSSSCKRRPDDHQYPYALTTSGAHCSRSPTASPSCHQALLAFEGFAIEVGAAVAVAGDGGEVVLL